MSKRFTRALFSVFILFTVSSCISQKDIAYFQTATTEKDSTSMEISRKYVTKVQSGDILSVLVDKELKQN